MNLTDERITILRGALEQRERDVMHHQINIDNYRHALADLRGRRSLGRGLRKFVKVLRGLLQSSELEQQKERIMLGAVRAQLKDLGQ